jgi:hypothetical protein
MISIRCYIHYSETYNVGIRTQQQKKSIYTFYLHLYVNVWWAVPSFPCSPSWLRVYLVVERIIHFPNRVSCSSVAQQPNAGQDRLILEVYKSNTITRHTRYDFSGRGIGSSQDIHLTTHRNRTRNHSKRATSDPRLKELSHSDRSHSV